MDLAKLDAALRQILDRDRGVTEDVVEDLSGGKQLGGEQEIGREDIFIELSVRRDVFRNADAHRDPARAQSAGEHRRRQVGLIGGRNRQEEVTILDPRALEHRHVRTVARHHRHVEILLDPRPPLGIDLDHHHIVTGERQRRRQMQADFTGAHDHVASLLHLTLACMGGDCRAAPRARRRAPTATIVRYASAACAGAQARS